MARMDSPDCFFNSIGPDLQKKRDAMAKVLEDVGLNPVVPEGGYFIMADWSKFADKVGLPIPVYDGFFSFEMSTYDTSISWI